MATCTYYAYNAPADMTESDFTTMINREVRGKVLVPACVRKGNETVLTFEEPGHCTELFHPHFFLNLSNITGNFMLHGASVSYTGYDDLYSKSID